VCYRQIIKACIKKFFRRCRTCWSKVKLFAGIYGGSVLPISDENAQECDTCLPAGRQQALKPAMQLLK
jgi:hypothetical protein